jgi:hypothetical protein
MGRKKELSPIETIRDTYGDSSLETTHSAVHLIPVVSMRNKRVTIELVQEGSKIVEVAIILDKKPALVLAQTIISKANSIQEE